MQSNVGEFAPYFRNGLLYLPEKTVQLLIEAGLERELAQAALTGLALDDNREQIGRINKVLEQALGQMEEDSQPFQALTTDDAKFMLTGKPSAHV
ncbi:MAG TPA: hypothetical protein VHO69_17815 [Phototrophicaceae bacterium]|jgi:hypothetical protein|nr:hypothetical protein [Phototrophicaceae bacterium]